MVLTEIVEARVVFNGTNSGAHDLALSRIISSQIAMDGRPVLWSLFREQAVTAPLATATTNLFSTTPENFGIGGYALDLSNQASVDTEDSLRLARHVGVSYYLVTTPVQVEKLIKSPSVRLLWQESNWYLFSNVEGISPEITKSNVIPAIAWVPAKFKSRTSQDIDLFNISEQLMFGGRPDINLFWAMTPHTDFRQAFAGLSKMIIVIAPSSSPPNYDEWIKWLKETSSKSKVIMINDDSATARAIRHMAEGFADFAQIEATSEIPSDVVRNQVVKHLIALTEDVSQEAKNYSWRVRTSYHPFWASTSENSVWLTGQGKTGIVAPQVPVLRWQGSGDRRGANLMSLFGVILGGFLIAYASRFETKDKA
jgi:hypothetical protein